MLLRLEHCHCILLLISRKCHHNVDELNENISTFGIESCMLKSVAIKTVQNKWTVTICCHS